MKKCKDCGKQHRDEATRFCNDCGSRLEEELEDAPVVYKSPPELMNWYFCWHPRVLLTAITFVWFSVCALWFIYYGIADIIYYFQQYHRASRAEGAAHSIAIVA